jgi:hypothetical protein
MSVGTILLLVLVVLLIGALPQWRHSVNWDTAQAGRSAWGVLVVGALLLTYHL